MYIHKTTTIAIINAASSDLPLENKSIRKKTKNDKSQIKYFLPFCEPKRYAKAKIAATPAYLPNPVGRVPNTSNDGAAVIIPAIPSNGRDWQIKKFVVKEEITPGCIKKITTNNTDKTPAITQLIFIIKDIFLNESELAKTAKNIIMGDAYKIPQYKASHGLLENIEEIIPMPA